MEPLATAAAVSLAKMMRSTVHTVAEPLAHRSVDVVAQPPHFLTVVSGPLATAVAVSLAKMTLSTVDNTTPSTPPTKYPTVDLSPLPYIWYRAALRGPFATAFAVSVANINLSTVERLPGV